MSDTPAPQEPWATGVSAGPLSAPTDVRSGAEPAPAGGEASPVEGPNDRPLLLLDVDGVLNAFPPWAYKMEYKRLTIEGFPIHFPADLPEMVAALRGHFEIVWFTLWNSKASPHIGPHVGLEDAPFLETSWSRGEEILASQGIPEDEFGSVMYAKTPLLPELLHVDQQWVWIDDAHSERDAAYLRQQGFSPENFSLIRTADDYGLTWTEVQRAIELAQAWSDGTAVPDRSEAESEPGPRRIVRPGSIAGRTDAVH